MQGNSGTPALGFERLRKVQDFRKSKSFAKVRGLFYDGIPLQKQHFLLISFFFGI